MSEKGKLEGAELFGLLRFVRLNNEIYFGSNHRWILQELEFGNNDQEIIKRLSGEKDLDMGLLYRTLNLIQVGENSQTFNYPNGIDLPKLREKTISVLKTNYPQEIFLTVDKIQ